MPQLASRRSLHGSLVCAVGRHSAPCCCAVGEPSSDWEYDDIWCILRMWCL
jgi:hypothetical protein